MSVALVPVKRLAASKSRLFSEHEPHAADGRETLALAMLRDVIAALRDARRVSRVVVTTPDAEVAAVAEEAGAEALVRDDPGLNAALDAAAAEVVAADEPLLVVLGDVAGALAEDIDELFAALDEQGGRGVVLAPASDGGTSALLRAPCNAIPSRFGPDSAARHEAGAREADVAFRELPLASLALDLDVPEDVARFLETKRGGRATRRALEALGHDGLGLPSPRAGDTP